METPTFRDIKSSTAIGASNSNIKHLFPQMSTFNSTLDKVRNLSIKDAIEIIPVFNGSDISLSTFIEGCRDAAQILPQGCEGDILKLIKLRLSGEALKCMNGRSYDNIDQIERYLEGLFGSSKTSHHLSGELAATKQDKGENVIKYANRIKSLGYEIASTAQKEGRYDRNFKRFLENDLIKFFIRGLNYGIRSRMPNTNSMDQAVRDAIGIEREFACYDTEESSELVKTKKTTESIKLINLEICQICGKTGHTASSCFKFLNLQSTPSWKRKEPNQFKNNDHGNQGRRDNFAQNQFPQNRNFQQNIDADGRNQYLERQQKTFPNQEERICHYCKKSGHLIRDCRKRLYVNNKYAQENGKSLLEQGAKRETSESMRPGTSYGSQQ